MSDSTPEVVGPYLVYEQIGKGGMATVHRAETQGVHGFRRPIALKRLLAHLAADPDLVQAFVHEARLASHLHHTNVAQTYDLGKVGDTYFIAMEYVPGATLGQILRQCNAAAGMIPVPIVINILIQICDGLDHAHNLCDAAGKPLGIIHRDVSPANIIVSNTGIVKLIDFGIAKAESTGSRTQTGMIKGKFGYVAPEYTIGQLDLRCDLFAVGVVAHELLTGRRLFDGKDNFDTLTLLREAPLQPPSRWRTDVPRDLDDIVMTALQRDPTERWQSAGAMRIALGNFARDARIEVGNQQVLEWMEWAFTRQLRTEDSGLARVIDALGEPSSVSLQLSPEPREREPREPREELEELDEPLTIARPSARRAAVAPMAAPGAPTGTPTSKVRAQASRPWVVVVLLLVLVASGVLLALQYYELPFEL